MGIIEKFFSPKTEITAQAIRARIAEAETEIAAHRAKIGEALAGVAALSDAEHIKIEGEIAATERAITRLESLVKHFNEELPAVVASEEATAKASADEALRLRAESARKATVEAKKLLTDYEKLASAIGGILQRLSDITDERNAVNAELRRNPVADSVPDFNQTHRKAPDRIASERRDMRYVYVYSDGTVVEASLDSDGNPKQPDKKWVHHEQRYITANIEKREIVVERTQFRPGRSEFSLTGRVFLPPAFSGGQAYWPRKS